MQAFHGRVEDIESALADAGLRYGISIGRRAPMHKIHVDCLHEIAAAGLIPVIFMGSTNSADSNLFDPVRNPMTVAQQMEQLKVAVPEYYDEKNILTLDDTGNQEKWFDLFFKTIENTDLAGKSAVHYRVKAADAKPAGGQIRHLSEYMSSFMQRGIAAWESFNNNSADDNINASDIRLFDLNNLTQAQKDIMASPEYIVALARRARDVNPDKALLEKGGVPVTVFDLTLARFRLEVGISTPDILAAAQTQDISGMSTSGLALHRQKYFPDTVIKSASHPERRIS